MKTTDTRDDCPFCTLSADRLIACNDPAVAIRDAFPVSPGHTLLIPKRHVVDWFDATRAEQTALLEMLDISRIRLLTKSFMVPEDAMTNPTSPVPTGFNIGINCGVTAGQTVMHLHVQLIPR